MCANDCGGLVMRRAISGLVASGLVGLALTVPSLPVAEADAPVLVADWQMNDAAGSRVMVDSSSNGLDGQISADAAAEGLTTNGEFYTWSRRCPACLPAALGRVVQVPDDDRLDISDPNAAYTLEFRFRTTHGYGNYMQKGQSTSKGGQIKVQGPGGTVQCLFKGADGTRVGTGSPTPLDDGQWHTVACVHTATRVVQYVDGVRVAIKNGSTGPINNKQPLTIGGKSNCDQIAITCDYFSGDIDYVKVWSEPASGNASPVAVFDASCQGAACWFDSTGTADPDGTIQSYAWDFGDGSSSTDSNPSHDYARSGTFRVVLTVTDNRGARDSAARNVTVEPIPPDPPENPSARAEDSAATVRWTAPSQSGTDPIARYVVMSIPDGRSCVTSGLSCQVTGLRNGESYTFRVTAESDGGSSASSRATNAIVPAGPARPPEVVTARAGDGRATVRWSDGKDNGSPITSYVVTLLPSGRTTVVDASTRRVVMRGLTNGRLYRFTVAAANAVGTGAATRSERIRPLGVPGRVLRVSAVSRRGAALVRWKDPEDNGSAVLRFKVRTERGKHRAVDGATSRLRFGHLKSGSVQRFRVRAVNEIGAGPWSKWTRKVTIG